MSDDDDNNLFSDSDDTAELIKNSSSAPAAATKKSSATKPSNNNNKKTDSDNEKGLFDSDSDDDDEDDRRKTLKKSGATSSSKKVSQVPTSKRERLEALAKNRHRSDKSNVSKDNKKKEVSGNNRKNTPSSNNNNKTKDDKGYDSGDSYDSGDFQRTAEDDDFIDTTGEDADAVQELYAEQHFHDDRPDDDSDDRRRKMKNKNKRKIRYDDDDNPDRIDSTTDPNVEPDNPIMAAVHRMKKKKIVKKNIQVMEEEVRTFLSRMDMAAEEDEQSILEKKPATKKLAMLNEVCDTLTKRDMQRMLLDFDLLTVCKRWVQPLPNGTLGNVTVRQRLIEVLSTMTGETGIMASDLKRSEFGKVVMVLFKHRSETPAMKKLLRVLIEQWSRPIFQKSGNMRDLERVGTRGSDTGLAAIARNNHNQLKHTHKPVNSSSSGEIISTKARTTDELNALIAGNSSGTGKKLEAGVNRVRIPYSRGFAFQVRPSGRVDASSTSPTKNARGGGVDDNTREKLVKRMVEKSKPTTKNQRSANISVEGRATKG